MPPQPGLRQNQGRGRAWATRPARARVCWISGHRCDSATQRCRGQRQRCANRVGDKARATNAFKSRAARRKHRSNPRATPSARPTRRRSRARNAGPRRRGRRRRRHRRARLVGAPAEEGQRARRRGRRAAAAAHGGSAEGRGDRRRGQGRIQRLQAKGLRAVQGESAEVCGGRRVVLEGH